MTFHKCNCHSTTKPIRRLSAVLRTGRRRRRRWVRHEETVLGRPWRWRTAWFLRQVLAMRRRRRWTERIRLVCEAMITDSVIVGTITSIYNIRFTVFADISAARRGRMRRHTIVLPTTLVQFCFDGSAHTPFSPTFADGDATRSFRNGTGRRVKSLFRICESNPRRRRAGRRGASYVVAIVNQRNATRVAVMRLVYNGNR